ncbi:MAG: peptidase M16 [Rhodospirillaceae bacterium]|nr:peptidase M16 [Rhodospirillaceae bacterium]
MHRWIFVKQVCVLIGLTLFFCVGITRAEVFKPQLFKLANGLKVVVISNHRAPLVTQLVMYKVGAMDEPPGQTGIAHFLEHLMFKGTKNLLPGEFSKIVARNGGQENAFTGRDYTGYHQSFASDRLEIMMQIESDRMSNLILTQEDIGPERQVVLEERNTRVENNPSALLSEEVNAAFYLNHPYRRPIIGWRHEIESISRSNLLAFYNKWYAPNNAILVIAGDVNVRDVLGLVKKYYGGIPSKELPPRVKWVEPRHQSDRRITLRHKQVRQPQLFKKFIAPGVMQDAPKSRALEILAEIIGGGTSSRIYQSIVVEQKIAASAGAWYDGETRGPGTFSFFATPLPGKSILDVERAIEKFIADLIEKGVARKEVAVAATRLQDAAIFARDGLYGPAVILGRALAIGLSVDYVEQWPKRISSVTNDDVNRAIRVVFGRGGSVTGLLLPEKKE